MKVMTFNVLCAGKGKNHWCRRQKLVKSMILKYEPDVFGLQEAHYGWMKYIYGAFKDVYSYIGVGKDDGGIKGEFSPVFYDKNKYNLLNSGSFWLSETPCVPGIGWDAAENRTCSYGVLEDRKTGSRRLFLNTHLDHKGEKAMLGGARLIINKINELGDLPVVLMGDFNVTPDSAVYKTIIRSGFKDARAVAEIADDINSFHAFGGKSKMIDFIFEKNGLTVKSVKTITDKISDRYPSDHFPVIAEIE